MSRAVNGVLIAVSILAAGVVGFGAYRVMHEKPAPPAAPPSSATAEEPDTSIAAATQVPQMRPVFALDDVDGKSRSITEWDGKTLVINFWATWCAPCRREIPMLKALSAARAAQDVVVIGIAVDFRDKVLPYAKEAGINYPLLIGEEDGLNAASAFGLGSIGLPCTVFVDAKGRIVTAHLGELHADQADLIVDTILDVNRGALSIEQARTHIAEGMKAPERKRS
jgi:thiol-disulfide isomerase/thioredoxin